MHPKGAHFLAFSPGSPGSSPGVPLPVRLLSVIIPTYKEVENIPLIVARLDSVRAQMDLELEVLFMDDDSRDGSAERVQALNLDWVRLVTRTTNRGLSHAVLEGLSMAKGDVLAVMDCDLSHPPEALPSMLQALSEGADFAIGSRFVDGGTTDDNWGVFRWLNSRVATLLAFPLTRIKDPMSGFFMLRRETFASRQNYNPIGYKIGLELLVKCDCRLPAEIPIHFTDRQLGESKLSLREQLRYLQHIRRLYIHRFQFWSELVQFVCVGAIGLGVNLLCLTLLLTLAVDIKLAVPLSIAISMVSNFFLNRRFSFGDARGNHGFQQFVSFISACSVGALVNSAVTFFTLRYLPQPQLAATCGVIAATGFNFVASRLLVFKRTHVTTSPKK